MCPLIGNHVQQLCGKYLLKLMHVKDCRQFECVEEPPRLLPSLNPGIGVWEPFWGGPYNIFVVYIKLPTPQPNTLNCQSLYPKL